MTRSRNMANWTFLLLFIFFVDQGYSSGISGKAEFTGNISGVLELSQAQEQVLAVVSGELAGLPVGEFQLNLVEGGCDVEGHIVREVYQWDQSEGESVGVEEEKIEFLLETQDTLSLAVERCVVVEGGMDCDVGDRIGCAEVLWSGGLGLEIIIIIIVAVVIFLLIVICVPIICCCIRRRSKQKIPTKEEDLDSLDDPFQLNGRSKSPMYDELSLPFIDASLPPTPKMGRTVNGLDILLGHDNGSRSSFADR